MREKPSRKCTRFVNLTILTSSGCLNDTKNTKLILIRHYGAWIKQTLKVGMVISSGSYSGNCLDR